MIFEQYCDDTFIVHLASRLFLDLNYVTQITVQNKISKFMFVNWSLCLYHDLVASSLVSGNFEVPFTDTLDPIAKKLTYVLLTVYISGQITWVLVVRGGF